MEETELNMIMVNISKEKALGFTEDNHRVISFQNRICVPQKMELRERILSAANNTIYYIHFGGTKMNKDLNQTLWKSNMKRDMVEHLDKCLKDLKIIDEHQ